jgi:hypothetical protein
MDRISVITNAEHKKQNTTLIVESRNVNELWAQHFGFRHLVKQKNSTHI